MGETKVLLAVNFVRRKRVVNGRNLFFRLSSHTTENSVEGMQSAVSFVFSAARDLCLVAK